MGAADYISRPFNALIVGRRVINTLMLYAKQRRLVQMVADQVYEREQNNDMMVNILSHIVEFRNGESGQHVRHIHVMTEILLQHLQSEKQLYNVVEEILEHRGIGESSYSGSRLERSQERTTFFNSRRCYPYCRPGNV